MATILVRNSLVLALHAMACVAGFIAGSSLPLQAERYSGLWRKVHDHAGPLAIAFVIGATMFSLTTQAFILGSGAATIAAEQGVSITTLLLCVTPHAFQSSSDSSYRWPRGRSRAGATSGITCLQPRS